MTQAEKALFDKAVQKEVQQQLAAFHQQFAGTMEQSARQSVQALDAARAALDAERKELEQDKESVTRLRDQIENEADKVFRDILAEKKDALEKDAQNDLLRELARTHLLAGRKKTDIQDWLKIPADVLKSLERILKQEANHRKKTYPKKQQLRYSDDGRGGTICYESPESSFDMWWEFAGGDALVILEIPSEAQWELRTKLPLEARERVLRFIGNQIVKDKISGNGRYKIDSSYITFYTGK